MDQQKSNPKPVVIAQNIQYLDADFELGDGVSVRGFSKKAFKTLYKDKKYKIIGEYLADSEKETNRSFLVGERAFKLHKPKTFSGLIYAKKGYLTTANNNFVVILKNILTFRLLVLLMCLILCAGIGFGVNYLLTDDRVVPAGSDSGNSYAIDSNATDWTDIEISRPESGKITVPGFGKIFGIKNSTKSNIALYNPSHNNNYFVISIQLLSGEEIFKSGLIAPGKGLYSIELNRTFEAGTYDAYVVYECFNVSDMKRLNGSKAKTELIIQ